MVKLVPGEIVDGAEFSTLAISETQLLVFDVVTEGDWVHVGECLDVHQTRSWSQRTLTTIRGVPFYVKRRSDGRAMIGFLPIGG
jgi:hypothetical protein